MEYLFVWFGLSIVVAVAANSRGRSGLGWFLLALVVSPLIAGLLVLALRPANQEIVVTERLPPGAPVYRDDWHQPPPPPSPASEVFSADDVENGIPYRTLADGRVEALLPAGRTIFANVMVFQKFVRPTP